MTATAAALYAFYSGFDMPAYQTDSVPDGAALPYITYLYQEPRSDMPATHYAMLYMRTNSNDALLSAAGRIVSAIGEGVVLPGGVVIRPASPLVQIMVDGSDPDVREAYINLQLNGFHTPGA